MFWFLNFTIKIAIIGTFFFTNCATPHQTSLKKPPSLQQLKPLIFDSTPDVSLFEKNGPFTYKLLKDFDVRVSKSEVVNTDVYFSNHKSKAPLVIIQHGNLAHKGVHRNQARKIASWGIHVMLVNQPNRGRWLKNGIVLAKLTKLLIAWPELLSEKFDPENIIVVGHSFGGSAAAITAAKNQKIKGVVFLDPALVNSKVKAYIRKIKVPSILLGADKRIFKSRKRSAFHRLVKGRAVEISVRNATHNDAQSPNLFSLPQLIGFEHSTSPIRQKRFMSALICSIISISYTDGTKFAWKAFKPEIRLGGLIEPKRK